jgi:hypothetical protein
MRRPPLHVLVLLAVGLGLRLWWLPLWGTFDTEVQKAWAARAAVQGVADIYGPSDREILERSRARGGALGLELLRMPFPRTRFTWWGAEYFVDYPPASILILAAAGHLYGLVAPELPNGRGFNAAINLAPLLASVVIVLLLQRSAAGEGGWRRALAFWLNPAVLLAAPVLGYQDPIFAALGLGAVMALVARRPALAVALVVAAGLVKPQGALLLPTLALVLWREGRPLTWLRSAAMGLATAAVLLLPWWSRGHLLSALDGCRRPLGQPTLAPLGLNVWWIAGYVQQWRTAGPWPFADILTIDAFGSWAGFDPRSVSRLLLGAATIANPWILARGLRDESARAVAIPLSVILQVHAYALLATSVHENHTFLAVTLAPLLLGLWPHARGVLASTSAFLFVSLFFAAGLGRHITRLALVRAIRLWPVLDLSVVVAAAHVVLVVLLFLWAWRRRADGVR